MFCRRQGGAAIYDLWRREVRLTYLVNHTNDMQQWITHLG